MSSLVRSGSPHDPPIHPLRPPPHDSLPPSTMIHPSLQPSPAPPHNSFPHPFPLFPFTPFKTLLLSSSSPFPSLLLSPHLPPPSHSFLPSQLPHRHLHQLKAVPLLSGRCWWRSSPAHAAAPAGPAALPSAGQVEPESPHSPPTSPHYPRAGNFLLLGSRRWLGWDLTRALERGLNCQYSGIIFLLE